MGHDLYGFFLLKCLLTIIGLFVIGRGDGSAICTQNSMPLHRFYLAERLLSVLFTEAIKVLVLIGCLFWLCFAPFKYCLYNVTAQIPVVSMLTGGRL